MTVPEKGRGAMTLRLSHRRLPGITVIVIDGDIDATNHEPGFRSS